MDCFHAVAPSWVSDTACCNWRKTFNRSSEVFAAGRAACCTARLTASCGATPHRSLRRRSVPAVASSRSIVNAVMMKRLHPGTVSDKMKPGEGFSALSHFQIGGEQRERQKGSERAYILYPEAWAEQWSRPAPQNKLNRHEACCSGELRFEEIPTSPERKGYSHPTTTVPRKKSPPAGGFFFSKWPGCVNDLRHVVPKNESWHHRLRKRQ